MTKATMNAFQFQRQYHDYVAETRAEAQAEADRVNQDELERSPHGWAVVVDFGPLGFGLMLSAPVALLRQMGVDLP